MPRGEQAQGGRAEEQHLYNEAQEFRHRHRRARRHEDAPDHRGQQRGAYAEAELPASPSPDPIIRVRPVSAEPQEPAETIRVDRPRVRRTMGG
jgi:hypothetical protein